MRADGTCPFCEQVVNYSRNAKAVKARDRGEEIGGVEDVPVPWHLKLLLGAAALYLGWRAVQGVEWVIGRF